MIDNGGNKYINEVPKEKRDTLLCLLERIEISVFI